MRGSPAARGARFGRAFPGLSPAGWQRHAPLSTSSLALRGPLVRNILLDAHAEQRVRRVGDVVDRRRCLAPVAPHPSCARPAERALLLLLLLPPLLGGALPLSGPAFSRLKLSRNSCCLPTPRTLLEPSGSPNPHYAASTPRPPQAAPVANLPPPSLCALRPFSQPGRSSLLVSHPLGCRSGFPSLSCPTPKQRTAPQDSTQKRW
jgi:hypothetical protein